MFTTRYRPSSSVFAVRVSFVAMLRTVTVALEMTAPFSSLTVPDIDPVVCATAEAHSKAHASSNRIDLVALVIGSSSFLSEDNYGGLRVNRKISK
jgi:hypothetical protein